MIFKIITISIFLSFTLQGHSCNGRVFNISSVENSKLIDFINQMVDVCKLNLILDTSVDNKILNSKLNKVYIKNKSLEDILDIVLTENNIFYALKDDLLKVSYIKTATYHIDYIASNRTGESSTEVKVGGDGSSSGSSGGTTNVGTKIASFTTFDNFWGGLEAELESILFRPEDGYMPKKPIINQKAGLITVSGTISQLSRVEKYLIKMEEKLRKQVLIDVNILSVSLNKSNLTGINWNEFYNNIVTSGGETQIPGLQDKFSSVITTASVENILQFLKFKGHVTSISNPRIVALNNQPAMISVGNEYFYTIEETHISDSKSGTSNTSNSTKVESVFAGVLLDITAEISTNNRITLNINPSVSQTVQTITTDNKRTVPPDLTKKQLSSVITTENGKKIVLGGLITKSQTVEKTVVPLLGYIPVLGSFFRSEKRIFKNEELIIIITPYIIEAGELKLDKKYNYINEKEL